MVIHVDRYQHSAVGQVHAVRLHALHHIGDHVRQGPGHILHLADLSHQIPDALDNAGFQPVVGWQDLQPFWDAEIQLGHWELL